MSVLKSQQDECFILVKALPHRSSKYFETVCCAGIGRDGKWRRQYPVPFRILSDGQRFGRWQWISYEFTKSAKDLRTESQKVLPESIKVGAKVKLAERARFLNPLVRPSLEDADRRGESLTLIRPTRIHLDHKIKSEKALEKERQLHEELARQLSMFDNTAKPLNPCPVSFRMKWTDNSGRVHHSTCDDWETSATYFRQERALGQAAAIESVRSIFHKQFDAGMVLAFSTHSRRNVTYGTKNQWLLVGMIRLDESDQADLLLS